MKTARCLFVTLMALWALAASGCTEQKKSEIKENGIKEIDLSRYKDSKPEREMRMLFIHHSSGGIWLAVKGQESEIVPGTGLYQSHPNGGGSGRCFNGTATRSMKRGTNPPSATGRTSVTGMRSSGTG